MADAPVRPQGRTAMAQDLRRHVEERLIRRQLRRELLDAVRHLRLAEIVRDALEQPVQVAGDQRRAFAVERLPVAALDIEAEMHASADELRLAVEAVERNF